MRVAALYIDNVLTLLASFLEAQFEILNRIARYNYINRGIVRQYDWPVPILVLLCFDLLGSGNGCQLCAICNFDEGLGLDLKYGHKGCESDIT